MKPSLVIIRGLPGSGKSTKARQDYPDHLHYEPDHLFCDTHGRYRYESQLWDEALTWVEKMVDFALARGENVVVSDVFCASADMRPFSELAVHHEASVKIITCTGQYGNIHNVPVTVLRRMTSAFQREITLEELI